MADKILAPDVVGKIEQHGIDFIPEIHRTSKPANIAWIMTGSCVTFPLIVVGWIPIALGLSWWASFWAVVIGSIFGAVLLAPMALLSPQTGTNNPVGSAAHFGVTGRIVGSVLAFLISVLFTALAIWTGGDAITASLNRMFGTSDGTWMRFGWYVVITVIVLAIAVYGLATMIYIQRIVAWTGGAVLIAGIFVFLPHFDANYAGGDLAFGGFWATWFAGAIPAALVVVGYSLAIGDWSRYISPKKHSSTGIVVATLTGGIFGVGGPVLWGAYTAATFSDPGVDYISGLIRASPFWFVPFLLYLGIGSGCAQGTVNMYSTGLDLSSIFPALARVRSTVMVGLVSFIVVLVGTVNGTVIANLTTFLDLLTVAFVSFVIVVTIGYWNHRGRYDSEALQVVIRREKGGRYWYRNGWNWRATVAFLLGTVMGLLGLNEPWYVGPLVALMGGIGLGFIVALIVAGGTYLMFLWFFPEDDSFYASGQGSRVRRPPEHSQKRW